MAIERKHRFDLVAVPGLFCIGLFTSLVVGAKEVRTADGVPGAGYWQQQVDYTIDVRLDSSSRSIAGQSAVRYHNKSPDALEILWFQLDQNRFRTDSLSAKHLLRKAGDDNPEDHQAMLAYLESRNPGVRDLQVSLADGKAVATRVEDTYLRIELPRALAPGDSIELRFTWQLSLLDRTRVKARSGYEILEDGAPIFLAAQWYPRAAVYHDDGWHLRPFLGQGEFSLEFGDFDVSITVPANYLVAATGELTNAEEVLQPEELQRLQRAMQESENIRVAAAGRVGEGELRWQFTAANVRDFAFVASPALNWEASSVPLGDRRVLTQVFYPEAGRHLWGRYGLDAVAHSLRHYSEWLFDYPWSTVAMVNVAGWGMEYPMLGVNAERGVTETAKWDMIGGIIHEVGHNWFPMTVNSNERLWAWMDEGLVSLIEYYVEKAWDPDFLIVYGEPTGLERYRGQPHQQPVMTPADDLTHRIDNAYDFAAAALNILRLEVLGPEVFDRALATYASNWRFRRATAEDFFAAMESVSGRDLDDFWQNWFYGYGTETPSLKLDTPAVGGTEP